MMAEAARFNVERGAQIVDINMGCPAKKVCNTLAGSALLKDEPLVGRILKAVVRAVNVPVTLKFRRSEEHTSELQSQSNLVCRLLLEKKKDHPRPPLTH